MTLAQLKDRPNSAAVGPVPGNIASSSVRHAAARLLAGNGSKALSYLSGGSSSRASNGSSRSSHFGGLGSNGYGAHSSPSSSHGGKGSFLVFNVGDSIYICDLNSPDKVKVSMCFFKEFVCLN